MNDLYLCQTREFPVRDGPSLVDLARQCVTWTVSPVSLHHQAHLPSSRNVLKT